MMSQSFKMRSLFISLGALCALSLCLNSSPSPQRAEAKPSVDGFNPQRGFTHVARRALPAVVAIQVKKRSRVHAQGSELEEEFLRHFFGRGFRGRPHGDGGGGGESAGQGSGFIISEDGYILTNNHVVGGADEIEVKLQDGRSLEAKLIGTDEKSDVAVIKVEERGLPSLKLGSSDALEIGEWVIAVGNPFGLSATLTVGVVSAKGRANMGITDYEDFIQTDAAINPGNSGGPLLNINGEVVGINTAIYSRSGGYMGIGFAIPIQMALKIKEQLISYGEVRRSKIGVLIQALTPEVAAQLKAPSQSGALIAEVIPGGPADEAGLIAGDIVLEMNGHPLDSSADLRNRVSLTPPQDSIKLKIWREGAEQSVRVQVEPMERSHKRRAHKRRAPRASSAASAFGLELQELSPKMARKLGLRRTVGVLISEVTHGSAAQRAGLSEGQVILSVNQREVASVKSLARALKKAGDTALLRVWSSSGVRFVVLSK
jgi:serine protease Do